MGKIPCSVKVCGNVTYSQKNDNKISFFAFPQDIKRAKLWATACNRSFKSPVSQLYKCYKVCADHFAPHMFLNDLKNGLQPYAVPILRIRPEEEKLSNKEDEKLHNEVTTLYAENQHLMCKSNTNNTEQTFSNEQNAGMPDYCCAVALCKSQNQVSNEAGEQYSFYKFPKDLDLRMKWIQFCRREKSFNPEFAVICSKHFKKEDYENNAVKTSIRPLMDLEVKERLKTTAIPSIIVIPSHNANEHVELVPEYTVESTNMLSTDSDLDLHIVSKKDLDNLQRNYHNLVKEYGILQKKYTQIVQINRDKDDQIEQLQADLERFENTFEIKEEDLSD